MPFYEFECEDHGRFEVYQGINEDHDKELCSVCKQWSKRVFSSPIIMGDLPGINKAKALESKREMEATAVNGTG